MGCRCVVLMLPHMGGKLRVDNPAQRHQPEREPCDSKLSNRPAHNP